MFIIETKIIEYFWGKETNAVNLVFITLIIPFESYIQKNHLTKKSKEEQLKRYNATLNHEKIHSRQQLELFIIGFSIWYLIELIIRYFQSETKNFSEYYRNISFEHEAYENSANLDYLKTRKLWSFLKYL